MYLNLLVQTVPWENLWTVIENIIYRFASTEHEVKTTLWCFNVNEKLLCYILFCILSSNIRMDNFVSFRPQVLRKKSLWLVIQIVAFLLSCSFLFIWHQIQKNWVLFETFDILYGSDSPDALPPFWNILGNWKHLGSNYCRILDVCLVKHYDSNKKKKGNNWDNKRL